MYVCGGDMCLSLYVHIVLISEGCQLGPKLVTAYIFTNDVECNIYIPVSERKQNPMECIVP